MGDSLVFEGVTLYFYSPSYTDQGGEESEGYESEEQLQHQILTAALEFVPTHGWTADAIAEGAKVAIKRTDVLRGAGSICMRC